ncbi:MAG: hypothetical protein K8S99_06815 [Planctomycetes bacterium]|nr:hypothetical protein [Planctomycetota bacterium]
MRHATKPRWHSKKTDETRLIEELLRGKFDQADAYRYNSAAIRVRVIDKRFAGKSDVSRDTMVERLLRKLPENIQGDIVTLITLAPGEAESSVRAQLANLEFDDPSPSRL